MDEHKATFHIGLFLQIKVWGKRQIWTLYKEFGAMKVNCL